MTAHRFTVNVAARHQAWRSEEIAAQLEWEPYNSWSVGDRRVTPTGTELPGIRQDTMCSFRFVGSDEQLTPIVLTTVEHLMSHREFVNKLLESGGLLALNIRLNGQFNSNFDLAPETLKSISDLGIRLSVECFPDG